MKILTIDIGTGTQDILLYDSNKEVENSLIIIMPSPTVIIADKIHVATAAGRDILLTGDVMGGGPSVRAIKEHLKQGLSVYATKNAALTINDNLDRVRGLGVMIVGDENIESLSGKTQQILLQDIDINSIETALSQFGVEMPSKFAVALQDHGESPDKSNRVFRFRHFEDVIKKGGNMNMFAYDRENVPSYLTRIKAASRTLDNYESILMDTGPAAIFGALLDPLAVQPAIVVNIGNGHTLGAIVIDNKMTGLFEHHTSLLDAEKLQDYIVRLANGTLTFDEVFDDGGHGCYIREKTGFDSISSVMVTGPKRGILQASRESQKREDIWQKLHFAAPFGNMMLSGCFGLLSAFLKDERSFTDKTYKPQGN
jgi:uncharacterized protein (DUF1786 family)